MIKLFKKAAPEISAGAGDPLLEREIDRLLADRPSVAMPPPRKIPPPPPPMPPEKILPMLPPMPEVVRYSPPGPQADFVVSSLGVCARNPAAPNPSPGDADFEEIGAPPRSDFYVSPDGAARSTLG